MKLEPSLFYNREKRRRRRKNEKKKKKKFEGIPGEREREVK
jgi:hypothetical protein